MKGRVGYLIRERDDMDRANDNWEFVEEVERWRRYSLQVKKVVVFEVEDDEEDY